MKSSSYSPVPENSNRMMPNGGVFNPEEQAGGDVYKVRWVPSSDGAMLTHSLDDDFRYCVSHLSEDR